MPQELSDDKFRVIMSVQRMRPFGRTRPLQSILLPIEDIHPVIRIAHRLHGGLLAPERIILDHELVYVIAGTATFTMNDVRCELGPRNVLFIPPYVPHRFDAPLDTGEHIAVHFDLARDVPPLAEHLPDRPPYQVRLTQARAFPTRTVLAAGDKIEHNLLEIVREFADADPAAKLASAALLAETLARMLRLTTASTAEVSAHNRERMERVALHIRAHLATPLSAPDLADIAGLSVSRMNALFRSHFGSSPHEFMLRARVDEARLLLADPSLSIKQVAAHCGFEDSFHFSKVFRKIDGLPPTRYRDAVLRHGAVGEFDNT